MADMLVKLYALPQPASGLALPAGIELRAPLGPEHRLALQWVETHFGPAWASELGAALGNRPATCVLAIEAGALVGFACHDATALGFFGPVGVAASHRGRGIGAALLRASLSSMRQRGYGYAIVGGVGTDEQAAFYRRVAGAMDIADSTPGVYAGMLRSRTAPG